MEKCKNCEDLKFQIKVLSEYIQEKNCTITVINRENHILRGDIVQFTGKPIDEIELSERVKKRFDISSG
jgi:hypothetical protein